MAQYAIFAVLVCSGGVALGQNLDADPVATVKYFEGTGCGAAANLTRSYTVRGFCNESILVQGYRGSEPEFMVASCITGSEATAACGAEKCAKLYRGSSRLDCVSERLTEDKYARTYATDQCISAQGTQMLVTCDGGKAPPTHTPTLNSLAKFGGGGEVAFFSDSGCETPTAGPGGARTLKVPPLTDCSMPKKGQTLYGMGCIDGPEAMTWCEDSQCVVACQFNTSSPDASSQCQDTIGADQAALINQLESNENCQILPATGCTPVYHPYDDDGYHGHDGYGVFEYSALFTCPKKAPRYPPGNPNKPLPPMVMVPGLTNSLLNVKLNNAEGGKLLGCNTSTHGEFEQLWEFPQVKNETELLCYAYWMEKKLNRLTQTFHSPFGVETELVDFGGIDGLPALAGAAESYEMAGWTLGKDFAGAPYDWRLPISQQQTGFIAKTKALVEKLYEQNENTAVVLMGVSFGPQNALGFLHAMTQEWKDKYIFWFVAISPVWSGSTLMLQSYVSGFGGGGHSNPTMTKVYLSLLHATPFGGWTFPRATSEPSVDGNYTWSKDDVVISTPSKNYTVFEFAQLFKDLGYPKWQVDTIDFCIKDADLRAFESPGVNTFVSYGFGVPTTVGSTYDTDFAPGVTPDSPESTMGSGDSLVPLRSSKRGYVWADDLKKKGKQLVIRGYEGQYHAGCMTTQPDEPNQCFMDWFALITNGTVPTSDAPDRVQEHTGFGAPFTTHAPSTHGQIKSAVPVLPTW